jgi:hypothetical protein
MMSVSSPGLQQDKKPTTFISSGASEKAKNEIMLARLYSLNSFWNSYLPAVILLLRAKMTVTV